jgi:hypothetical protein
LENNFSIPVLGFYVFRTKKIFIFFEKKLSHILGAAYLTKSSGHPGNDPNVALKKNCCPNLAICVSRDGCVDEDTVFG